MKLFRKIVTTLLTVSIVASLIIFGDLVRADSHLAVRKSVVDLTPEERTEFVHAIKALKTTTLPGHRTNIYDEFVAQHISAMGLMAEGAQGPAAGHDGAHESNLFLPWHREFIHRFEQALQSVNPRVRIPYWDWTNPKALEVIFQDDFMGPNGQGVTVNIPLDIPQGDFTGANGQAPPSDIPQGDFMGANDQAASSNIPVGSFEGGPVVSGRFSLASGWVVNPDLHFKPSGETLGESLLRFMQLPPTNSYPVPKEEVKQILAVDDYETFRLALEGFIKLNDQDQPPTPGVFMHNYFHSFVGGATFDPAVGRPEPIGTLADLGVSINDPIFWLIHSNVDRLWAEWQEDGHGGSDYYPATGGKYGENLNDYLWPWDGGESTPANQGPGDVLSLLPALSPSDIIAPIGTLDFRRYGYTYDTVSQLNSESASTLGIFGLGAFATIGWQIQKQQKRRIS